MGRRILFALCTILAVVSAAARKANDRTRSMGVALSSCIIPASGKPIFGLGERDMEIGMGLHGEPGVHRGQLAPVDAVAAMLVSRILADQPLPAGSEVAVLVNGFGATPLAELIAQTLTSPPSIARRPDRLHQASPRVSRIPRISLARALLSDVSPS